MATLESTYGNGLVFAVESKQPLSGDVKARVWTIGYRVHTPFGMMPKLYMDLSATGYIVHDQGLLLPTDSVTVISTPTRSEVRIPLSLLGTPERTLVLAHTIVHNFPLDNIPSLLLVIVNQ